MFKKIIFSLLIAGSSFSFAQNLEQGKNHLRTIIEKKGLLEDLDTALTELSQEKFFTVVEVSGLLSDYNGFKSTIAKTPKTFFTATRNQNGKLVANTQGQEIQTIYGNLEKAIAASLTENEKALLKNYLNKNHSDYYNDDKIINYLVKLKQYYSPLYNQLYTKLLTLYNLTPCYPYTEKTMVNGVNCDDLYGSNDEVKESLESSTVELLYALAFATYMTSVPGCTKYEQEVTEAQKSAYKNYLTKVGKQTNVIPFKESNVSFSAYAIPDVFNFDFYNYTEESTALLADCNRIKGLISNL